MTDRQITDVSDLTRHDLTQTRNQVYNLADNGHVSHHFASNLIMLINAQMGRLRDKTDTLAAETDKQGTVYLSREYRHETGDLAYTDTDRS